MNVKINKKFAIIFLLLIGIIFFHLVVTSTPMARAHRTYRDSYEFHTVPVDWEASYPYTANLSNYENKYASASASSEMKNSKVFQYFYMLRDIGGELSSKTYKNVEISDIGHMIQSKLGDVRKAGGNIKLENGHWIEPTPSKLTPEEARSSAANYAAFKDYLEDNGMHFMYCFAPMKECAINQELLKNLTTYTNKNIDTRIKAFENYGIDCLDLRTVLHSIGSDHYDMFYKTDHHWKLTTGPKVALAIENAINEKYGIKMQDSEELGTYKDLVFEGALFGSNGKAVSRFVEDPEDLIMQIPNFKTKFRIEMPDMEMDKTGTFEDIFIDYDEIKFYQNLDGGYAYDSILYGNRPYVKITNLENREGPKILMIRDSMSLAVAPYLALSCSELVLLDVRPQFGNFTGSVISCIEKTKPDVVLALQRDLCNIKLSGDGN